LNVSDSTLDCFVPRKDDDTDIEYDDYMNDDDEDVSGLLRELAMAMCPRSLLGHLV